MCWFISRKCYRTSKILCGRAVVLTYWMFFLCFCTVKSEYPSCGVFVSLFYPELKFASRRGEKLPLGKSTKSPYLLKNRVFLPKTVIPHSSKNKCYKCSRVKLSCRSYTEVCFVMSYFIKPWQRYDGISASLKIYFCCEGYCRMPSFKYTLLISSVNLFYCSFFIPYFLFGCCHHFFQWQWIWESVW